MPRRERVYSCRLSTSLGPHLASPYLVAHRRWRRTGKVQFRGGKRGGIRESTVNFRDDPPSIRRRFLRRSVGKYRKIDNRLSEGPRCFAHLLLVYQASVRNRCLHPTTSGNEIFSNLSGRWISIRLQIRARAISAAIRRKPLLSFSLFFFFSFPEIFHASLTIPRDFPHGRSVSSDSIRGLRRGLRDR